MIKNVIFDVNKVLRILKDEPLENYLSAKLFEKYKKQYNSITSSAYIKKVYHNSIFTQYDLGLIEREDLIIRLSEKYHEPVEVVREFMDNRCLKEHNVIFEPMINLIKELRENGIKTYILSNMGKDMSEALMDGLGKENFDDIVYSCDVHMIKPNKEIFKYAIERFKINPEESLFVDDTEHNLIPFKELGGYTYLFDYKKLEEAILQIKNLVNNL